MNAAVSDLGESTSYGGKALREIGQFARKCLLLAIGTEAALERRKLYALLPDVEAGTRGLLRVIDESGEDYLYQVLGPEGRLLD